MSDNPTLAKATAKYVAEINEAELCCRMLEAAGSIKRQTGVSAEQAFGSLDEEDRVSWRRAARAAMDYWRECINAANRNN